MTTDKQLTKVVGKGEPEGSAGHKFEYQYGKAEGSFFSMLDGCKFVTNSFLEMDDKRWVRFANPDNKASFHFIVKGDDTYLFLQDKKDPNHAVVSAVKLKGYALDEKDVETTKNTMEYIAFSAVPTPNSGYAEQVAPSKYQGKDADKIIQQIEHTIKHGGRVPELAMGAAEKTTPEKTYAAAEAHPASLGELSPASTGSAAKPITKGRNGA